MRRNRKLYLIGIVVALVALVLIVLFVVLPAITPSSPSPAPISVGRLALSSSSPPLGPEIEVTLENTGTSPVTNLSAQLGVPNAPPFDFPNVTRSTPLEPGLSAMSAIVIPQGTVVCGASYSLEIRGIVSSGSTFQLDTSHSLSCAPPT